MLTPEEIKTIEEVKKRRLRKRKREWERHSEWGQFDSEHCEWRDVLAAVAAAAMVHK